MSSITATNSSGTSALAASQAVGDVVASRDQQVLQCLGGVQQSDDGSASVRLAGQHEYRLSERSRVSRKPDRRFLELADVSYEPQSNQTYSFCHTDGLSLPSDLTNVTFYGDDFRHTADQDANVVRRIGG